MTKHIFHPHVGEVMLESVQHVRLHSGKSPLDGSAEYNRLIFEEMGRRLQGASPEALADTIEHIFTMQFCELRPGMAA